MQTSQGASGFYILLNHNNQTGDADFSGNLRFWYAIFIWQTKQIIEQQNPKDRDNYYICPLNNERGQWLDYLESDIITVLQMSSSISLYC
jgi:hypothetical protein